MNTAPSFLGDFGRQQMATAVDASCAMQRGFESVRRIQQGAAHAALARHKAAAQKLHGGCDASQLQALQAALWQGDLQAANQYWQELGGALLEMQTEMMGCASHLVDSESALHAVSSMEAFDSIPGVAAMFGRKPAARAARAA